MKKNLLIQFNKNKKYRPTAVWRNWGFRHPSPRERTDEVNFEVGFVSFKSVQNRKFWLP